MKNNEFTGLWISKEILNATDLNSNDKIILSTINALDGDKGCYASFDYIAECTGISRSTVIRSINKMVDNGYIDREYINKTSTILRIASVKMKQPTSVKMKSTSIKLKPLTSVKMNKISVKLKPNNIYNINKYNNNNTELEWDNNDKREYLGKQYNSIEKKLLGWE